LLGDAGVFGATLLAVRGDACAMVPSLRVSLNDMEPLHHCQKLLVRLENLDHSQLAKHQ
jgi:hypothetical protein